MWKICSNIHVVCCLLYTSFDGWNHNSIVIMDNAEVVTFIVLVIHAGNKHKSQLSTSYCVINTNHNHNLITSLAYPNWHFHVTLHVTNCKQILFCDTGTKALAHLLHQGLRCGHYSLGHLVWIVQLETHPSIKDDFLFPELKTLMCKVPVPLQWLWLQLFPKRALSQAWTMKCFDEN